MSERTFTVRPYQPGDEHGILELFNRVFAEGAEHFEPRTPEAWRWEFRDNPAGTWILVAEDASGALIGHYAGLPALFHLRGTRRVAGQGVDSMVHPDWRRSLKKEGPFLAVARAYFDTYGCHPVSPFTYGFPNERAIRVGKRLLGYDPVVEPLPTLYRNFFEAPDDDAVGAGFAGALEVREVPRFGADVDALWQRLEQRYPLATVRDLRYLRWRYEACAHLRYRCHELRDRDGSLRGWFVTRANWQSRPIQALVDFLADPGDEASVHVALRTVVREARASGQARVEAWFPERSPFFAHARAAGFGTEPCNYVLCIRIHDPALEHSWVQANWYYTIGDSDIW